MMINTLEKLFIAVVGAVGMLFIYGMLSMAWAGSAPAEPTWLLYLTVGPVTNTVCLNGYLRDGGQGGCIAHPHVQGHFATQAQCEFIGKSVTRDLRAHGSRGTEFYCASEPKHGQ